MDVKNNSGWDAINDDLASGFVIAITPTNSASKILVNMIVQIGLNSATDSRWWGIKLYRKIGTGAWTEVTGANGTETGDGASTSGTPVWISNNFGAGAEYKQLITSASGTYLDAPNTTEIVYYTAYWHTRLGDGASNPAGNMYINRSYTQEDIYRPAPSSSWTATEIWDLGTTYSGSEVMLNQQIRDFLSTDTETFENINIPRLMIQSKDWKPDLTFTKLDTNDNVLSTANIYISSANYNKFCIDAGLFDMSLHLRHNGLDKFVIKENETISHNPIKIENNSGIIFADNSTLNSSTNLLKTTDINTSTLEIDVIGKLNVKGGTSPW